MDWSEDSADDDDDDDEEEAERFVPFQTSWRPQNGLVSLYFIGPYYIILDLTISVTAAFPPFPQIGWRTTAVPLEGHDYLGFARTSRRNTSTCAGRRGQVSAKRDTAMPSVKPCCTLPVTTQTALGS